MAGLDELFNEIPVQEIASRLGADEGEVNNAIRTLVPALVGGLQHNVAADDIDSSQLEKDVTSQAASGLLDGGVSVDQVDQKQGDQIVANIFNGNDSNQVASALAGGGLANSGLLKQLLPILAPIVLAYIGKQLTKGGGAAAPQAPRRRPPVAAVSATSSAAFSVVAQAVAAATTRWAASSAACSGRPGKWRSRRHPRRPARR
jgi:hypothetical protein